ncbi:MAG TPA: hypothetical protein VKM72_10000 [Thermoanaerobaculia bacterium]|nr:hypothetical protein [Thermoanaerobaculia bacterium]
MRTQRKWFEIGVSLLLASALLACQGEGGTASAAAQGNRIPSGDVLVPVSLGRVQEHFDGTAGHSTVFVIGENHVSFSIQRRVADLLAYMRNAYGVKVVCTEGMDGSLALPAPGVTPTARRESAEADFAARRISGVEFFALAYPDVRVVGVEDMQAYAAHQAALSSPSPEIEAWFHDFQDFLKEDVQNLPEHKVRLVEGALQELERTSDLDGFIEKLRTILGPGSAEGRKLAELVTAREQIIERERIRSHANDPMMSRRDKAMVQGTLNVAVTEPVALVVGSFHLEGIAQKLKAAGQPYVSILVTGAGEMDIDDIEDKIYKEWQEGKMDPLEEWLSRLKPTLALQRATKQRKVAFLGALFHANDLLRQGLPADQVPAALRGVLDDLEIVECYLIDGGYEINFRVKGKKGRAYFSSRPLPALTEESRPDRLENGKAGGLYYAVFDGGSGGPPIIPRLQTDDDGGDPFNKRLVVALAEQRRRDPSRVTLTLVKGAGGALVLLVGEHRRTLSVSEDELRRLVEAYRTAEEGPEVLLAAQNLAAALLIDIDRDLPPDGRALYLIAKDDLLQDVSLPEIAALANEPGTARFREIEESFILPWKKAQSDLDALSRPRALVEIEKTVFWIGESLAKDSQHAAIVEAIQGTGERVNEPLRPGDTLVLVGSGEGGWTARLTNGAAVTAKASALRGAKSVVALGVNLPQGTAQVDALMVQKMKGDEALSFARELAERIKKGSGKETLDRVLRKRSAEKSKSSRELAHRSLAERFSKADKGQQKVERTATLL